MKKPKIYFKIFECNGHQVLVERDFDVDDEKDVIIFVCHTGEVRASAKLGFDSKKGADKAFEKANQEAAQKMFDQVFKPFFE